MIQIYMSFANWITVSHSINIKQNKREEFYWIGVCCMKHIDIVLKCNDVPVGSFSHYVNVIISFKI